MKKILFLFLFSFFNQLVYATSTTIYMPDFTDKSGKKQDITNIDILYVMQQDPASYDFCIQSQQPINEIQNINTQIFSLKNLYGNYLPNIDWNDYNKKLKYCINDGDAMTPTHTYSGEVNVRYAVPIRKNLTNTSWNLPVGFDEPEKILSYPSGFFLTRVDSGNPDFRWSSLGVLDRFVNIDYLDYTHIPIFSQSGSSAIFNTSGVITGKLINMNRGKTWQGLLSFFTDIDTSKPQEVRFLFPSSRGNIQGNIQINYLQEEILSVDLYNKGIFERHLQKNIDFWVKPSRIEAGMYFNFHPEKFQKTADEVRVTYILNSIQ